MAEGARYHRQTRVKNTFFRYMAIIGHQLCAQDFEIQEAGALAGKGRFREPFQTLSPSVSPPDLPRPSIPAPACKPRGH